MGKQDLLFVVNYRENDSHIDVYETITGRYIDRLHGLSIPRDARVHLCDRFPLRIS